MTEQYFNMRVGSQIWCVMMHHSLHRISDPEISICAMKGVITEYHPHKIVAANGLGDIISDENHYNYPSKNEAIDAMIRYLEGLRDGENL